MTFLKNLKAGDQVIVVTGEEKLLREVTRITPAGRIRVSGVNFNHITGYMYSIYKNCKIHLEEATPEAIKELEKQNT